MTEVNVDVPADLNAVLAFYRPTNRPKATKSKSRRAKPAVC
jgi:hypothetical protein